MRILKRVFLLFLFFVMLSSIAFAGGQGEEKSVTLKLSTHQPADSFRSLGSRLLKEEIEKATDGKVKIDIYYASSIQTGAEVLTGIRDRVVEMGMVNPSYYPGQLPVHQGMIVFLEAPGTYDKMSEVVDKLYEMYPELLAEIEDYNQKVMFTIFPCPFNLSSTVPVKSMDEFKGLKIRAANEIYLRMLGDLGAIPVSVPWNDCYMALQTGTIDAVWTNIESEVASKFYEPAPYGFTSVKMPLWIPFTYTINQDVWDKFSPEVQEQINGALEIVKERYAPEYDKAYEEMVEIYDREGEGTVIASDEDVEIWRNLDIIETLFDELAEKVEKNGVAEDGWQFIDDVNRVMTEAME
jgi:TRAP-type C4-dicarboxylate transport system substrate-binding protein